MDDLIYNELVASPGYALDFAVGTTYSLDAEAFLAVALAFARLGECSDADLKSPLRFLEGLRQANSRVALFCNRGGLKPPQRPNPLFAMLDRSVFEVADERKGNELANFHPKIWVIKERSLDNTAAGQIKLIVMSRNLTKDSSLDIAVSMVAPLGVADNADARAKHKPLKDFLLALAEKANAHKRRKIRRLAADLDSAGAFLLEQPFEDYDFLPICFGDNLNRDIDIRAELPGERMIVVSPFIDADTLQWMNARRPTQDKILITRLDSLTPDIMELYSADNREIWVMSQLAGINDIQPMDLHAKMFFSAAPLSGGTYLWLGSANATPNGFSRNSEFMLRLRFKRGRNRFEDFKAEFCDDRMQLCERVSSLPAFEPSDEDNSLAVSVRRFLIARNNLSARVVDNDGAFNVVISAARLKGIDGTVSFAPVQEPANVCPLDPVSRLCEIGITARAHLSEFYILSVTPSDEKIRPVRMVIKIPTSGLPDDRDDHIFRSLIDSRDKFLDYVELMITDRPQELAGMMVAESYSSASLPQQSRRSPAIYESLLRVAASEPQRLNDLNKLVDRLDASVVPESFAQMCAAFRKCVKL